MWKVVYMGGRRGKGGEMEEGEGNAQEINLSMLSACINHNETYYFK